MTFLILSIIFFLLGCFYNYKKSFFVLFFPFILLASDLWIIPFYQNFPSPRPYHLLLFFMLGTFLKKGILQKIKTLLLRKREIKYYYLFIIIIIFLIICKQDFSNLKIFIFHDLIKSIIGLILPFYLVTKRFNKIIQSLQICGCIFLFLILLEFFSSFSYSYFATSLNLNLRPEKALTTFLHWAPDSVFDGVYHKEPIIFNSLNLKRFNGPTGCVNRSSIILSALSIFFLLPILQNTKINYKIIGIALWLCSLCVLMIGQNRISILGIILGTCFILIYTKQKNRVIFICLLLFGICFGVFQNSLNFLLERLSRDLLIDETRALGVRLAISKAIQSPFFGFGGSPYWAADSLLLMLDVPVFFVYLVEGGIILLSSYCLFLFQCAKKMYMLQKNRNLFFYHQNNLKFGLFLSSFLVIFLAYCTNVYYFDFFILFLLSSCFLIYEKEKRVSLI